MEPGDQAAGGRRSNGEEAPPRKGQLTLLELLLIVAVLGAVGVFAWSTARKAKMRRSITANESSAIASLKTLITAEEQYKVTGGGRVYATLSRLSATSPPYIDGVLARGKKSGYSFVLTLGTPADSNYAVQANPVWPGVTGGRYFFVDSAGVIRLRSDKPASSADDCPE